MQKFFFSSTSSNQCLSRKLLRSGEKVLGFVLHDYFKERLHTLIELTVKAKIATKSDTIFNTCMHACIYDLIRFRIVRYVFVKHLMQPSCSIQSEFFVSSSNLFVFALQSKICSNKATNTQRFIPLFYRHTHPRIPNIGILALLFNECVLCASWTQFSTIDMQHYSCTQKCSYR